jgi:hypothetical protein
LTSDPALHQHLGDGHPVRQRGGEQRRVADRVLRVDARALLEQPLHLFQLARPCSDDEREVTGRISCALVLAAPGPGEGEDGERDDASREHQPVAGTVMRTCSA